MSKRTTIIIVLAALLVVAGVVLAQVQRVRKTGELLDELHSGDTSIAIDTLHELKKRGHSTEGRLILKLGSDERRERMRAALLLGEVGRPAKSGPALVPLLKDESDPVRRAAADSLGLLGYGGALLPLMAIVKDPKQDMNTRSIALRAVSMLVMKTNFEKADRDLCAQDLVKILRNRPAIKKADLKITAKARQDAAKRRENAARVAAGRPVPKKKQEAEKPKEAPKPPPPPGALPEEPVPADTEVELRADAVLALGLLGTDFAVQPLIDSGNETVEPSPVVRKCTCMAIEDLRDLPRDDVLRVTLGQALLHALHDSSPDVRMSAARALARHADLGNEGLDTSINDMLKYMAQDLTEYGEPDYWVRAAAKTACDARHVVLPKPAEPLEGQSKLEGPAERPKAQAAPK